MGSGFKGFGFRVGISAGYCTTYRAGLLNAAIPGQLGVWSSGFRVPGYLGVVQDFLRKQ